MDQSLKPYTLSWFEELRRQLCEECFARDWGAHDFANFHNIGAVFVVRLKARIYNGIPREEADKLHKALTSQG